MTPRYDIEPIADGALVRLVRNHRTGQALRLGPNMVHAAVIHADGSVTDLGISQNLLTTVGRTLAHQATVLTGYGVSATIATASSATSLTATGTPWTVDQYKGWTVVAEEGTNAPDYGNIGSNTTSVLTVDAWRNADDSAGTTPGATANYAILPTFRPRFMGLTENASAASAASTTLTGEITTGGANRQIATAAYTAGNATSTLSKTFTISASFPAVHRIGLFTASNVTAAGVLCYEVVLNADANVISGDSLACTWTLTISG